MAIAIAGSVTDAAYGARRGPGRAVHPHQSGQHHTDEFPPGKNGCNGANGRNGRPGVVNGERRGPRHRNGGNGERGKHGCRGPSWRQ